MSTIIEPQEIARPRARTEAAQRNGRLAAPAADVAGRASFWTSTAPAELRAGRRDASAAWKLYWKHRKLQPSLGQLADSPAPLAWSANAESLPPACRALLELAGTLAADANHDKFFKGKPRKQLQSTLADWLEFVNASPSRPADKRAVAVSSLAAAHVLAVVGGACNSELGWKLIDALHRLAAETLAAPPPCHPDHQDYVAEQHLACELPLTLSWQFADMAPLHELRQHSYERLSTSLGESLDREGLPHSELIGVLRPLAACWSRCRTIGETLKAGCWSNQAERRYRKLVRQLLRWTAPDGTAIMAIGASSPLPPDFLRQALGLADNKKNFAAAQALFGTKAVGAPLDAGKKTPSLDEHCESSGLALMRSGWTPDSAVVAIDFSAPEMKLEVWAAGRQLLKGAVNVQSYAEGELLAEAGDWDELCWFADKDAAYLELSLDLTGGARLERQILLGRRDGILLLVDHLKTPEGATLRHDWQLPIGPGLLFCGEGETRDALLVDGVPIARLIPLALPEWRIDPRVGDLAVADGRLRLSQQVVGTSMACPLFVDLRGERSAEASTWRQLTVAEWLEIQTPDVAVAYRIQCGKDQWVYYRAQSTAGNRSFLGQNTSSECIIARFDAKTGEISELVEIES